MNMFFGSVPVSGDRVADCFADFFDAKVKKLVENVTIDPSVQNGIQQNVIGYGDFMIRDRVYECMKQLKTKNCEGYDRIPQRFIPDGLTNRLSALNGKITLDWLNSSQDSFKIKCITQLM